MKKLCFASHNPNKIREICAKINAISPHLEIVGLDEIGCTEEIAEIGLTLEENSHIKARYVWDKYKIDCFSDDTGLEVKALGGAPGVSSARYAGSGCKSEDNIRLLLENMAGKTDRSAVFRTVFTLIVEGSEFVFEGRAEGEILSASSGAGGFGYDPVFRPAGHDLTFAEMAPELKNKISQRAKGLQKLMDFLGESYINLHA